MKLTIHRGTHEIGGSCLELTSSSDETRLVIDVGLPLVNVDGSPFEWNKYKSLNPDQLLGGKILPRIMGLYENDEPRVAGVLLSHAHLDHYGLFRFIHSDIPLYMSRGTRSLAEVSNIFLGTNVRLDMANTFEMWQPFQVGEFTITPYLVDHSAPDAAAFLVEGDGQRLFYTGDFRGHGRKRVLLERLATNPPPNIGYLVMEGSMFGRSEGLFADEDAVEQAIYQHIHNRSGPTYIFASSQNLDRLVSIFRATKRSGKIFLIDLYTAFVLDKLGSLSPNIPQFDWEGIRVLFSHYHAGKLAEQDKRLLYKYRKAKIDFEELKQNPQNKVLLTKDSRYFRILCSKLCSNTKASAIYSMWHGYLERSDLSQFLEASEVPIKEIHTSGHAYVSKLKELADALRPSFIIPMHTFHPEKYADLFSNVIQLKDGEMIDFDGKVKGKRQEPVRRRALSEDFSRKLKEGIYHPLVQRVRQDKDLDMEFRGTYINVYYQGHNILNLKKNGSVAIDNKFRRDIEEQIPKVFRTSENLDTYLKLLPKIKDNVAYSPQATSVRSSKSRELEFEQLLIRTNNLESRNNSEYIILDRQYVVNRGKDRWDLVALRWPIEKRGRPYQEGYLSVIEVKYAQNPDIQNIKNQVERYARYLKTNLPDICDDMKNILDQKLDLDLLAKTDGQIKRLRKLPIVPDILETEIIIYLIDYNNNSLLLERAKVVGKPEFKGRVRVAFGGLALWQSSSEPW